MSQSEAEPGKRRRAAARAAAPQADSGEADRPAQEPLAKSEPGALQDSPATQDKTGRRVSARASLGKVRASGRSDARAAAAAPDAGADAEAQPAIERTNAAADPALHDMERDLAGLLHDIEGAEGDAEARRRAADAIGRIAARLHSGAGGSGAADDGVLSAARQLLSTDYHLRQWGRRGMRGRSDQIDDFGLDPTYEARVQPLLDLIYERYFRVAVEGIEHVPAHGAALLVCNHGGTLPWDGVMLKTALRHTHPEKRGLRWLTDDYVFHAPFLGAWLNRVGAVRACPENAERLLERGDLLAVFPEGVKGVGKLYRERHRLQRFGRGGHVKLALRMRVPLIPLAIVGAEESYPLLHRVRAFSKLLGIPFIPVTPLFPWLGPLGLLPLPSRWQIAIGEPMHELSGLSARMADDTVVVNDLNERLRGRVQALLDRALEARGPTAYL